MIITGFSQRRDEKNREASLFGPVRMMVALCKKRGAHEPNDAGTRCRRCATKLSDDDV